LEDYLKSKHPGAQVRKTIVERENWNQEWQNFFKPVIISDKTVVLPEWENPTAFDQAIQTRIRPAMAFGTGTHETTQLCLKLLESAVKNGDVILDLGTGSGILGITALHLGASHVDGIDNDANVAENTLDNIKLNQVEDKFRLLISENPQLSSTYDLLLVNMIKARLLPILPRYFEQVNRGGIVIVSGLLQSEDEEFRAIISGSSWIITDKIKMNEWIAYRCDVE
jgi:ribosomal protein L11 methyltransferase